MLVIFCSCNKKIEVGLTYKVNVEVDPNEMIGGFSPYQEDDFNAFKNDSVRISLFVYNKNSELVEKTVRYCNGYSEIAKFSLNLPVGQYSFVATSDIVLSSDSEAWTYYDVENINGFYLKQNYNGVEGLLGLKILDVNVDKPQDIKMMLAAATSLVRWEIVNIHSDESFGDSLIVENYFVSIDKEGAYNDSVSIENGNFTFSASQKCSYYHLACLNPSDIIDSIMSDYGYFSILPINNTSISIMANVRNVENDTVTLVKHPNFESIDVTLEMGKQYIMNIDFENYSIETKNN